MLEAKEKGLIRHIGITNHRLSVAAEAIESGLYETLQFPFCYLATKEDLNNIDALPSQTGNSGKYLTTNGTEASWASFPPVATLKQW